MIAASAGLTGPSHPRYARNATAFPSFSATQPRTTR